MYDSASCQIKTYKGDSIFVINSQKDNSNFTKLSLHEKSFNLREEIENLKNASKNQTFKKKLLLKGLGYKPTVEGKLISFKLNCSHSVILTLPSYINDVKTKKKSRKFSIAIGSSDKILLGNFAQKIINKKPADIYKGKGFRIKGKKMRLKQIKKK